MISQSIWRYSGFAVLWSAAMVGVLQFRHLDSGHSAFLCGPWGCAPPLEALAAYHTGWLVVFAPVVIWLVHTCTPAVLRRLGHGLWIAGLVGLLCLGLWQYFVWYPVASDISRQYAGRCYLIALLSLVDVPILQLILVGPVLHLSARWKQRQEISELASRLDDSRVAPADGAISAD